MEKRFLLSLQAEKELEVEKKMHEDKGPVAAAMEEESSVHPRKKVSLQHTCTAKGTQAQNARLCEQFREKQVLRARPGLGSRKELGLNPEALCLGVCSPGLWKGP